MKFVTATYQGRQFVGMIDSMGERVLDIAMAEERRLGKATSPVSLLQCIALGAEWAEGARETLEWAESEGSQCFSPLAAVRLEAPIPRPTKNVMCVGKNYAEHAIEMGSKDDIPEHIMMFTKSPTAVIGSGETIPSHKGVADELDYEGELAVVIGRKGKEIRREDALDYVFGYTIINDVTARDLQRRHKQFFIGKSLDGTCPMGPWILHTSAIDNPNNLNIHTKVNGEVRQDSNTEQFIFPVEEIISVLSKGMTLEPGDIIATGTPAGVGKGFKPPKFLQPGDKIEITVEKIGTLSNSVGE
ncbi:fumarylacetoacetate hydrolase family protein [Mesobacillus zeae]|uniref:FAA hydrolase family protein n=1 Tax=Mesobacillus zeae TaxID=1917180 RepID=A0A398B572_9BACI|nr:fumarylacetoacetate hydrolase family protein [Mesobacillus zeae]RID84584.1 FAA hydrolase family protein [Mesobacillus zeae]